VTYALLRHGQTEWNRLGLLQGSSDIPLNETGRTQARDAARSLVGSPWRVVVSSPLQRARETAQIVAESLGIQTGPVYPDLRERDYGDREGTSAADALAGWPDRDYPGAEPIADVVERGMAALTRIAEEHGEHDVLVVGHGTQLRFTLAEIAGHPLEELPNGRVATIRREHRHWVLASYPSAAP
jgi:probable phosphoglycerate mutase